MLILYIKKLVLFGIFKFANSFDGSGGVYQGAVPSVHRLTDDLIHTWNDRYKAIIEQYLIILNLINLSNF